MTVLHNQESRFLSLPPVWDIAFINEAGARVAATKADPSEGYGVQKSGRGNLRSPDRAELGNKPSRKLHLKSI